MADYDIVKAIKKIEDELIASMIRNLDRHRAEENDLGINWEQWQAQQLAALEQYKKRNLKQYRGIFGDINSRIESIIRIQREAGNAGQEITILQAIKEGAKLHKATGKAAEASAYFFKVNDRKMDALIKATTDDMEKAEHAMLRMSNDQYRKVIFNAQVFANSGAGTYAQAVDMATKDFLRAGINCVEYKNGARHTLSDYADMAIRTASKRAYLTGEGEKRKEWGISTVIMNKRGNPCPLCLPFVGKVLIDDVWSGGSRKDGAYPLMSSAIAAGLYHPRCKDGHTTYFQGVSEEPDDKFTQKELDEIEQHSRNEAKQQYAERQAEKLDRMAKYSLDENNKKKYAARAEEWKKEDDRIAPKTDSAIIKLTEDEELALNKYISFDSYRINDKLRGESVFDEIEEQMKANLDKALKKFPRYEGNLSRSLYFGDEEAVKKFAEQFQVGNEISFKEFISTTCSKELYNTDGEVQIFIQNAKYGRNLSEINVNEQEVLYERNSCFKVCNVVERDGKYWILLEEC